MSKALVIRTCNADMTSHGGFKWPTQGHVECPDWDPTPQCGHGLHGLLDGIGDYSLLSQAYDAKWLVVQVERSECVGISEKVKFPRGEVVYCGFMAGAMGMIAQEWVRIALADKNGAQTTGNRANAATTGYGANAATTGE